MNFAKCVANCITTFVKGLGWFALAAIVACLIAGAVFTPAAIAVCLGFAVGGAALAGIATCIACC